MIPFKLHMVLDIVLFRCEYEFVGYTSAREIAVMASTITSIRQFNSLSSGTHLRVTWPGNELDGKVVVSDGDGDYASLLFCEVTLGGEARVLNGRIFDEGCCFTVLD